MQFANALGQCPKCFQDMVQAEGQKVCLNCSASNNPGSGLTVKTDDPGEAALNKVLKAAGVRLGQGEKPVVPIKPNVEAKDVKTSGNGVLQALQILRELPMPNDLKQFKQIHRAIQILEKLGA